MATRWDALRIPREWTYEEAASLLAISITTLRRRIEAGHLDGHVRVSFRRPPGAAHAYRLARGFVSSTSIARYMKALDDEGARVRAGRRPPASTSCACRCHQRAALTGFDSSST